MIDIQHSASFAPAITTRHTFCGKLRRVHARQSGGDFAKHLLNIVAGLGRRFYKQDAQFPGFALAILNAHLPASHTSLHPNTAGEHALTPDAATAATTSLLVAPHLF